MEEFGQTIKSYKDFESNTCDSNTCDNNNNESDTVVVAKKNDVNNEGAEGQWSMWLARRRTNYKVTQKRKYHPEVIHFCQS